MGLVNFDDTSSAITYGGGWVKGGTEHEFDGTTHGTNLAGSTATIRFTGSSITIFGTVSAASKSPGPVSTYNLDGGNPVTFAATPGADDTYGVTFYTSPQLPLGDHTLVITTQKAGAQYWLDYFAYNPDGISSTSTSTTVVIQPTPPAAGASTTTTTQNTPTTAPPSQSSTTANGGSPQGQTSTKSTTAGNSDPTQIFSVSVTTAPGSSSTPAIGGSGPTTGASSEGKSIMSTGPIIGIVLGALALIVAILLLLWLILRKRRRATMPASALYASGRMSPPNMGTVEAFRAPSSNLATNNSNSDLGAFRKDGGYQQGIPMSVTQANSTVAMSSSGPSEAGTSDTENLLAARYGASKGQQVLVIYEPYPAEAPPDYHHRHAGAA